MVDRAKIGKNNKRKGNEAERYYAKELREIGYEHCITSRMGSKLFDDCGIDLMLVPYNIQVKAGEQKGMKPVEVLRYMKDKMREKFPPESAEFDYPSVLIHRKPAEGPRRTEFDELVTMTYADWKLMAQKIHHLENAEK